MDPVKVIIFVAAFLLLLLLGRKLSATEEIPKLPSPDPAQPAAPAQMMDEDESSSSRSGPAITGAELPFPVPLPELEMDKDGRYNRPEFLNYFFSQLDLVEGPPDPASFIDDFFVETRNPEDQHVMTYKYVVCTPAGLQGILESERLPSLSLGDSTIIVSRWNLTTILNAAVQEIIKSHHDMHFRHEGEHALPESDDSY